ncbi:MAG TPA: amidase [Chloroflexota bacterium]|nr:amidase [Chloroflexota bacterium]
MANRELEQEDLQLRRHLMRQAIDRVRAVDLGESYPLGSFTLGQPPRPAPGQFHPPAAGLPEGSALDLARRYRAGEVSPVQVATRSLERAQQTQTSLNAFITILNDRALQAARASEERFRQGQPLSWLDGIPIAVKDIIHIAGVRTTCASELMSGFIAESDAPVISRLRTAGAILIGKTNLHEFAYGATGDVSCFGPARNPRNPEHITGGSSSGSAAAVAAGICPIALGTDTAGSVRIPAALCGIIGLKPTYGRVSSEGVLPLSWSLDHVGPLAGTVADAALALAAMSDFALPDLTHLPMKVTIGVCRQFFFEHLDDDVRRLIEAAMHRLGEVREVEIPHIGVASPAQTLMIAAEARAFHSRWLASRGDEYDWSIRNRLEAAGEVGGADYVLAARLRSLLSREMSAALEGAHVLAMPTVACPAPKIGQREVQLEDGPADATALMVRNTGPINFTGFPAITMPCGETSDGLPVGLQLVAPPWEEARLLQIARAFETRTP